MVRASKDHTLAQAVTKSSSLEEGAGVEATGWTQSLCREEGGQGGTHGAVCETPASRALPALCVMDVRGVHWTDTPHGSPLAATAQLTGMWGNEQSPRCGLTVGERRKLRLEDREKRGRHPRTLGEGAGLTCR